ncbi:MAG TPA: diphthine synthase, partial [Candidatus Woesearchaeota archaeon]|nr:diphthine synthase [Candidatus Woesearchaeota archaeon]
MVLYFIGIGLYDEKDVSLRGLEVIKKCDVVYLENYTSILSCNVKKLEKLYGKKIILSSRDLVEKKAEETILKDALSKNVAFLVIGDPMSAT